MTPQRLRVDIVIETADEIGFSLWPVLGGNKFTHVALSRECSDREIGSAVHAVLHWFYLDENLKPAQTITDYLERALDPSPQDPTRPLGWGGPRFTYGATTIVPGCCLSIDERHELRDSLTANSGVWLGHDPSIGVTLEHGVATVVQDDGDEGDDITAQIQTSERELKAALDAADVRLSEFIERAGGWAARYAPNYAKSLTEALASALAVPAA
ncbi:hypothetical protein NBCG_03394 [Nocardioidaceae bacterium Broad-1]|nr:hypothetical protein NBCG_03394 [Nocardioidaceae bacterium Broad-1]